MSIEFRSYQAGDEEAQAAIWNQVATCSPGFKPVTIEEVRRRTRALNFTPDLNWYAVANGTVVGYCIMQPNGRVGYPWCLRGEEIADRLLDTVLQQCKRRGLMRAFTAYRADWTTQLQYFEKKGFTKVREMVNFAHGILDLPTMIVRRGLNITSLQPSDLPAVNDLAPGVLRIPLDRLENWFFHNPYFPPESLFVLRRSNASLAGVGILIDNQSYADPTKIDPQAPCFRLGAFGTEECSLKRVNGMFSFLVRDDAESTPLALDLLSYVTARLEDGSIDTIAAQVPSDARHLLSFYQRYFRKQGSFPVYERSLIS